MGAASRWIGRFPFRRRYGYRALLFRAKPSNLDYFLLTIGTSAAIAAGVPFPLLGILFGQLVDDFNSISCISSPHADKAALERSIQAKVMLMIYISIGNFRAIYVHTSCWSLFGERLVARLRRCYFKNLLRQEIAFFDNLPAGEVPTRLTTDMETIRVGTSERLGIFISSLAYLAGGYTVALLKVPRLAAMLTFMIPAYVLMVIVGGIYISRFTARASQHFAAATSVVSQSLSNVALIHALGAHQRLEARIVESLEKVQRAAMKKAIAAATQFGFTFLVAYSGNAVAFWQGSSEISRAAEASFVISQVAPFLQIFGAAAAAGQTLSTVADRNPSIDGTLTATNQDPIPRYGDITFREVTFSYPSRPEYQALKSVSFKIAEGDFTTIVGSSGSGKSTIRSLMTRLYDSCTDRILLGGNEISTLNVRQLRQSIGVVDQDPAILYCSVLENIAFGIASVSGHKSEQYHIGSRLFAITKKVRKGQDLRSVLSKEPRIIQRLFEEVEQAAILANAHEFIQSLQYGYATLIGSVEMELSGGQKQRLALARALVRDPPILLLDEATSALDSISEQEILASLKENRREKTTVTIAHRLGTVKDPDHIIVLHDGLVVEEGTHDELLRNEGRYKAMTEAQTVPGLVSAQPSGNSTTATYPSSKITIKSKVKRPSLKSFSRTSKTRSRSIDHDPCRESARRWTTVKSLYTLARPQLLFLFIGFIGAVIAGGAYSGDAVIFGTTINKLDPCNGISKIKATGKLAGVLFFILAVSTFLANSVGGSAFGRVAEKIVFRVRILTFRSLIQQDLSWHTSNGRTPALLLSNFTADTSALAALSGVVVGTILTISVNLVASILMTHIIAWKIPIVLLATLPILLGSGFMRLYALSRLQIRHQKLYTKPAGISLEVVASIKTIASYSLEEEYYERYCRSLRAPYKASLRGLAYTNFWLAIAYSVSFLIYALAYWWGARQIINDTYSQTQFFIVLPALLFSAQACGQMFALAPVVSNARLAATRLFDVINAKEDNKSTSSLYPVDVLEDARSERDAEKALADPAPAMPIPHQKAMAVEMRNVRFAYPQLPNVPVLNGLDLSIQAGQFCALVGPSGAGKSTIFSLLESFYMPSSGTVNLDNRSITTTTTPSHRSSISLVPQSSALFSDTIGFNIALGAHSSHVPTNDELVEACKQANIHSLIASLPQGYQTQCGANASHLSGGQKQRLCIARALVRQPRLMLLDEPTSALDAQSETSLQETIESLRGRMTILVVAHRLCTVQRADRIFWIEGGTCTYSGTHQELLLCCKGYKDSAAHQSVG